MRVASCTQFGAAAMTATAAAVNMTATGGQHILDLKDLRMTDVGRVGGKNASLGEMISGLAHAGVRVPGGFATTADAYREFLAHGGLDQRISAALATLDTEDVKALAAAGQQIRGWMLAQPFPPAL